MFGPDRQKKPFGRRGTLWSEPKIADDAGVEDEMLLAVKVLLLQS